MNHFFIHKEKISGDNNVPCWELWLPLVEKDIIKHGGIITGQGGLEFKIYDFFYCQNFTL